MAIIAYRIRGEANGLAKKTASPDRAVEAYLAEALGTTLDNFAVGVIIVAEGAHILHANAAARRMLEARSPVVSLGGCLGALEELQRAIAARRGAKARISATPASACR